MSARPTHPKCLQGTRKEQSFPFPTSSCYSATSPPSLTGRCLQQSQERPNTCSLLLSRTGRRGTRAWLFRNARRGRGGKTGRVLLKVWARGTNPDLLSSAVRGLRLCKDVSVSCVWIICLFIKSHWCALLIYVYVRAVGIHQQTAE